MPRRQALAPAGLPRRALRARGLDASGRAVGVVHGFPVAWTADGRSLLFRRGHSLRISPAAKLAGSRVLVARWDDGPVSLTPVGHYAYKITWSDGHDTGIFTLEHLRELGQAQ